MFNLHRENLVDLIIMFTTSLFFQCKEKKNSKDMVIVELEKGMLGEKVLRLFSRI